MASKDQPMISARGSIAARRVLNIGHLRARKDLDTDLAGKCKPLFIIREEKLDQLLIASLVLTDRTVDIMVRHENAVVALRFIKFERFPNACPGAFTDGAVCRCISYLYIEATSVFSARGITIVVIRSDKARFLPPRNPRMPSQNRASPRGAWDARGRRYDRGSFHQVRRSYIS